MGVFDRQIATAKRLIAKNGQNVKWLIVSNDSPTDAAKPWQVESSKIEKTVRIAFLPVSLQGSKTKHYSQNGEIHEGSVLAYMGAVDFEPSLKDLIVRDGKNFRILDIDKLSPNGEVILYTMILA